MITLAWLVIGIGISVTIGCFYYAYITTKSKSDFSFVIGIIGLIIILGGIIGGTLEVTVITQEQIESEKKVITQLNCLELKELILNNKKKQKAIQNAPSPYWVNCTCQT